MLKDIKERKMRYKSFVDLHTPTHCDLVVDPNNSEGDIRSITETYQKIIEDELSQARGKSDDKITFDSLPKVTLNMASDDEDDQGDDKSTSQCIILEIPKSRRSSFHGESLELDFTKSTKVDSAESRRESQDLDNPVEM